MLKICMKKVNNDEQKASNTLETVIKLALMS